MRRAFVSAVLLVLVIVSSAMAGTATTKKTANGESLRITYTPDPDGTVSCGEIVVTVSAASGRPSLADREIEFVLYTSSYYSPAIAYSAKVKLPQNAMSATTKIQYSQLPQNSIWAIDAFEDGMGLFQPRVAFSSASGPQRKNALEILPDGSKGTSTFTGDFKVVGLFEDTSSLSKASGDWRSYQAYDVVVIEASLLPIASESQIQAWSRYALAGGNLIIHQADAAATPLLWDQLSSTAKEPAHTLDSRWTKLNIDDRDFGMVRSQGGGKVVVLENVPSNWIDLVRNSTNFPMSDIAISVNSDTLWFWRNLVQTVGKTPIWGFVGFMTLFVIGVGPILLRLTDKLRHRTLLLFLVPAFSLVATLLFLMFNVTREGFGTRGRVAAIQYFDTTTEQGFVWSRQSYFSGAPPRTGLKFSQDAFVKPVFEDQLASPTWGDPRGKIGAKVQATDEGLFLTNFLFARSQKHLLSGEPISEAVLPIKISEASSEKLTVSNTSDQKLPIVLLKLTPETCFLALDLAVGESREIKALSLNQSEINIRVLHDELLPQVPIEIDVNSNRYVNRSYFYTSSASSDPIENAVKRLARLYLQDYGYWIVSEHLPSVPLPFEPSVYEKEKNFVIRTGATRW